MFINNSSIVPRQQANCDAYTVGSLNQANKHDNPYPCLLDNYPTRHLRLLKQAGEAMIGVRTARSVMETFRNGPVSVSSIETMKRLAVGSDQGLALKALDCLQIGVRERKTKQVCDRS